jgi:hypothetical protein
VRMARSTGAFGAGLIAPLAIWAALVPFVGPYFDYAFGPDTAWHLTTDRLVLDVLPGLAALLASVWLLLATTRRAGFIAGSVAVLAGLWLVVGPAARLPWDSGRGPIGPPLFGPTHQMLELIGYFYGVGASIAILGAVAIGRFSAHPTLFEEGVIDRGTQAKSLEQA